MLRILPAVILASFAVTAAAQDTRPNLVLVLADDISAAEYDFLTATNKTTRSGAKTPTLNMMRTHGVSFLTAWSMPICGPTRGSLMTGLYGQITGWVSNQKPPGSLGTKFGTFTTLAKRAGYKVLIAGKWQMVGEPDSYGFDESCLWEADDDPTKPLSFFKSQFRDAGGDISQGNLPQSNQGSRYWKPFVVKNGKLVRTTRADFGPDVMFDCAKDFISRQTRAGNKFLVYIPALLAHADYDYNIDDGKFNHYLPVPQRTAAGEFIRKEPGRGTLKRNIEYQDYLMKTLLSHLRSLNQTRNTITFFMGDNGTLGYGKGQKTSETATRVPFLVYGPGRVQKRGDSGELVSTNDMYSTLKSFMQAKGFPDTPRPHSVDISRYLLGLADKVRRRWLYGILFKGTTGHWLRTKTRIYDANSDLWKCSNRDERSCTKIAPSAYQTSDRQNIQSFNKIICLLQAKRAAKPGKLSQPVMCE